MSVPVEWLFTGLWAVTMLLAGALGNSLRTKMAEMAASTKEIADTVRDLAEQHARVDERVAGHERRLDRVERALGRGFDA